MNNYNPDEYLNHGDNPLNPANYSVKEFSEDAQPVSDATPHTEVEEEKIPSYNPDAYLEKESDPNPFDLGQGQE